MLNKLKISVLLVVFVLVCTRATVAQCDLTVNIPVSICAGDSVIVTFGFDDLHNVKVQCYSTTMGHGDLIFLPDGHDCPGTGCVYHSEVDFRAFDQGALMTSANDIKYLRVKIEHSYIADLYFDLRCPNGTKVDLMRFGGTLNTECADNVPSGSRTWLEGSNTYPNSYFGMADHHDGNYCDSSAEGNEPGVGWNYCWSNNTNSGYVYPSGDGIIYRWVSSHHPAPTFYALVVDSSNVSTGNNFYHPDESFSNLIGCPLNGVWSFEAMDGFGYDNGYIFEWELAFDPNLCRTYGCTMDTFNVVGDGAYRIDDTSFVLTFDTNLVGDTTICYRFEAMDDCDNHFDTTVCVTYHPVYRIPYFDTVVENMLPYEYNGHTFEDGVSDYLFRLSSTYGCDSLVDYSLKVWPNVTLQLDTLVCGQVLPVEWRGYLFEEPSTVTLELQTCHGADSTVTLSLVVEDIDTVHQKVYVCKGKPYTWIDGNTYYVAQGSPIYNQPTSGNCDSVYQLHLFNTPEPFEMKINAQPNPATFDENTVYLRDVSNSVRRTWSFYDRLDTSRSCSFVFPYQADSVEVNAVGVDRFGCEDSANVTVYKDMALIWAPTAFTPDEQNNNVFAIMSKDVVEGTVTVYTRGGLLVTSFDLLTGSWDGTYNGILCPQGSYVWHLTYRSIRNTLIVRQARGTVTLLR